MAKRNILLIGLLSFLLSFVAHVAEYKNDLPTSTSSNNEQQVSTQADKKSEAVTSGMTSKREAIVEEGKTNKDITSNPQATATEQDKTKPNSKNDSFIPTEAISEDLAVSFPTDI